MIERFLLEHRRQGIDDLFVGDRPVGLEPRGRVRLAITTEPKDDVGNGADKAGVLGWVRRHERREPRDASRP